MNTHLFRFFYFLSSSPVLSQLSLEQHLHICCVWPDTDQGLNNYLELMIVSYFSQVSSEVPILFYFWIFNIEVEQTQKISKAYLGVDPLLSKSITLTLMLGHGNTITTGTQQTVQLELYSADQVCVLSTLFGQGNSHISKNQMKPYVFTCFVHRKAFRKPYRIALLPFIIVG